MKKSLFEQIGGTYRRAGDYLLPNITLPEETMYIIAVIKKQPFQTLIHSSAIASAAILRFHIEFHNVSVARLDKSFVILVVDLSVKEADQRFAIIAQLQMTVRRALHGYDTLYPFLQEPLRPWIVSMLVQFFGMGIHQNWC